MKRVYRVLRKPYSKRPLDGQGAYRFGGRWSSPGTRIAYTSEHLSLAMIEYFVHLDLIDPPADLVVATADVPDSVSRLTLQASALPPNWRGSPAPAALAELGDTFVHEARAAILVVPSVLAPDESNWLINPAHPEARKVRVSPVERFRYDSRFFGD